MTVAAKISGLKVKGPSINKHPNAYSDDLRESYHCWSTWGVYSRSFICLETEDREGADTQEKSR